MDDRLLCGDPEATAEADDADPGTAATSRAAVGTDAPRAVCAPATQTAMTAPDPTTGSCAATSSQRPIVVIRRVQTISRTTATE